jgi:nucleoside diphosphate kinase
MNTIGNIIFMKEREKMEINRVEENRRIEEKIKTVKLLSDKRDFFISFIKYMKVTRSMTVYQMEKDKDVSKARKMIRALTGQINEARSL